MGPPQLPPGPSTLHGMASRQEDDAGGTSRQWFTLLLDGGAFEIGEGHPAFAAAQAHWMGTRAFAVPIVILPDQSVRITG